MNNMKIIYFLFFSFTVILSGSGVCGDLHRYGYISTKKIKHFEQKLLKSKKKFSNTHDSVLKYDDLILTRKGMYEFTRTKEEISNIKNAIALYNEGRKESLPYSCMKKLLKLCTDMLKYGKRHGESSEAFALLARDNTRNKEVRRVLNSAAKTFVQFNAIIDGMLKGAEAMASAATASGDGG